MRKTNYHMHTKRCMHASGSDEEYVLAAIQGGYEEIGFSDHCPWKYDSDFVAHMRMPLSQFNDYYQSIAALRDKYKDQISIKIGLECEYFPKYMKWLDNFKREKGLDYMIFGNHYYKTDEKRIYFGTECEYDHILKAYIDEAIQGMETGLYAYLAHPDLFMHGRRNFDQLAIEESFRLCEAAKRLQMPLEYNLNGALYNDVMKVTHYPHPKFWEIAAQVGNDVIIGVDAHEPKMMIIDKYRDEAIAYLTSLHMNVIDSLPGIR